MKTNLQSGRAARSSPLTTRDCADYMGFTPEWIRQAIDEGVIVGRRLVQLEAEAIRVGGRRRYRIHLDAFVEFLQQLGWKRLPERADLARVA